MGLDPFFNVNTPDDVAAAERALSASRSDCTSLAIGASRSGYQASAYVSAYRYTNNKL